MPTHSIRAGVSRKQPLKLVLFDSASTWTHARNVRVSQNQGEADGDIVHLKRLVLLALLLLLSALVAVLVHVAGNLQSSSLNLE